MNKLFIGVILILTSISAAAQKTYETLQDTSHENSKILRGILSKSDIANDTSFTWYPESQRIYPTPNPSAVAALQKNKDKIYFIIFGGTWCEDTHFVLPKFFKIQEASGFPENRITFFAVDRSKHTTGSVAQAMGITNVPTIIVMKDGKEIGRLVEYGKTGKWDEELAAIINK